METAKQLWSAAQDEAAAKKYSECISYEHVIRSVIQNPKALSSEIWERGGDQMGTCVRVCVCVCKEGRVGGALIRACTQPSAHLGMSL